MGTSQQVLLADFFQVLNLGANFFVQSLRYFKLINRERVIGKSGFNPIEVSTTKAEDNFSAKWSD